MKIPEKEIARVPRGILRGTPGQIPSRILEELSGKRKKSLNAEDSSEKVLTESIEEFLEETHEHFCINSTWRISTLISKMVRVISWKNLTKKSLEKSLENIKEVISGRGEIA